MRAMSLFGGHLESCGDVELREPNLLLTFLYVNVALVLSRR